MRRRRALWVAVAIPVVLGALAIVWRQWGDSAGPFSDGRRPKVGGENARSPIGKGIRGIGVYPTSVEFSQALRGGQYLRNIGIINAGGAEQTFTFETAGGAAPWLSVAEIQDPGRVINSISIPAQSQSNLLLRVRIPETVANGDYTGSVVAITGVAKGGNNQGAATKVGAKIQVSLGVTGNQHLAASLMDVSARDVETGYPLRLGVKINNSGNIQINPQLRVTFLDGKGQVYGNTSLSNEVVDPAQSKLLGLQWDTQGQPAGERVARISAKFNNLNIGDKDILFKILPQGTLTRRGEVVSLALAGKPKPGDVAKIFVTFRNTGQIETQSKFVGEIYKGSDIVQAVSSEKRLVMPGETVSLEVLAKLPKGGKYSLKGKVNYEGRETPVKELSFRAGLDSRTLLISALVVLCVLGVVWMALQRRRRSRGRHSAPARRRGANRPPTKHGREKALAGRRGN